MRQIKRWRFYCDFCKKVTGTRQSMVKHEKGCTANANRECGVCKFIGDEIAEPLSVLRQFVRTHSVYTPAYGHEAAPDYGVLEDEEQVKTLREMAGNCPCCIFAAIRQENSGIKDFDLKAELKSIWADVNETRNEGRSYAY